MYIWMPRKEANSAKKKKDSIDGYTPPSHELAKRFIL
jgi:hypothetical protein